MARLILSRLATLIPLMLIATSIVFFLVRFVPGDPVRIMVGVKSKWWCPFPVFVQVGLFALAAGP